ncbi:MAG: TraX family protein, partial [Rickettsiales bacterium]
MEKLFKTYAYGHTANTYDALKAIALLTMVVDHIGRYFFPEVEAFRAMGRIAFPLFLFLVGYSGYTKFSPSLFIGACCVLLSSGFT